jgi:uncharacterized RDD family membrane protein YckC
MQNQKRSTTVDDNQIKKGVLTRRFIALLTDYLLLGIYAGVLFLFSPIVSPLFQKSAGQSEFLGLILLVTPVFLYFFLFEASHLRATPGKLLLHIKVIKIDGTNFNYKNSFVRSLVKFIPWEFAHFAIWQLVFPNSHFSLVAGALLVISNVLAVLYIAFPFFNRKARAIHDYAAHTMLVIKLRSEPHS